MFQSGPNLDTMRGSSPQPPNAYQSWPLPPANQDDPKPTLVANYDTYLTNAVQPPNATGPVGALPLQAPDPSVSSSVTSGLSVDFAQRRFNLVAPVLSLAGRAGLNLALALSYSNNLWQGSVFNVDRGFPAPGWRLGFGSIQIKDLSGPYYNSTTGKASIIYLAPDGTRTDMALNPVSGLFESYDGTYLQFNAQTQLLTFPNGLKMLFGAYSYSTGNYDYQALPIKLTDRNGNYISINYRTLTFAANNEKVVPDYVTDTAGRRINFEYQNNRLTGIKQNRGSSWFYFVRLGYSPVALQTNFAVTDPPLPNGTQVWLLTSITYPTGSSLRFTFNGYAQIAGITKWAPTINGQGAERQVNATVFNYGTGTTFSSRAEGAENWQNWGMQTYIYDSVTNGSGTTYFVTDPTARRYSSLTNGLTQTTQVSANNGSVLLKTDQVQYVDDGLAYRSNPRLSERLVTSNTSGSRKTTYGYVQLDGIWLQTTRDDYVGNTATVYRRTTTEYTSYPARRILGLPTTVSVYAGPGTTLMSRTTNTYDQTGTFTDSNSQTASYFIDASQAGVLQHDDGSYGPTMTERGNLTSVTQSSVVNGAVNGSRINKRLSYDTNGNLRADTDGSLNRRQFAYTDNYSNKPTGVAQTHVYLYSSADPTDFRHGSQYDYYSGKATKTFNLTPGSSTEEQVTLLSYDFADRPTQTTRPDGGWTKTQYWDNWLYQVSAQLQNQSGATRYSFQGFDGASRAWRKASDHEFWNGTIFQYAGQQFIFDQVGRQSDASNQITITGNWTPHDWDASTGWVYTNTSRDELERLKLLTRQDGNVVQYDYAGCDCGGSATTTVTDELGCQVKTETDFLGRKWKVKEMSTPTTPYNQVTYTYDVLDRITQISHADGTGTQTQTRSFAYDGYGHLQSETTPEAGTNSYTYKLNDLVETTTNALGKVATYTYNTRNLLTGTSYNDGGATPTVSFQYDAYGARSQMTDGEGTTTYAYDAHRHLQSETRTFNGLLSNSTLTYAYNLAEQVTTVNYRVNGAAGAPVTYGPFGSTQAPPYTLSGQVTDQFGNPMAGVTITAKGESLGGGNDNEQATTNSSGQYSFTVPNPNGDYTLTPSKAGYFFNPSEIKFTDLNRSRTANLMAIPQIVFDKNVNYAYTYAGFRSGIGTGMIGTDPLNEGNVVGGMYYRAWGAPRSAVYNLGAANSAERYTLTRTFNTRKQLETVLLSSGYAGVFNQSYSFYQNGANNGRIRQITDNLDPNYTTTYTLDNFNRLTSATAAAYTRNYTYDPWGNLRTVTGTGGPSPSYTIAYAANGSGAPATNQISTAGGLSYGYDQAGNLTQEGSTAYSYDAANRLKEVGTGGANAYGFDGDGLRVRQIANGNPPRYYVRSSVLKQVVMDITLGFVERAYIWQDNQLVALQSYDGQFYWAFRDHLGNVRKLGNTGGSVVYRAEFDPHGQAVWETGITNLNPHKFGGYERDVTGLDYVQARSYTSNRGRYLQSDPYGTAYRGETPKQLGAASLRFPQSHNRYGYAWNDGASLSDPSGLSIDPCCACPGHGEGCEGREAICPQGGSTCVPTCDLCCTAASIACVSAAIACESAVAQAKNNGKTACLNNNFCDPDNASYDPVKCDRCLDTVRNNFLIGTAACGAIFTGCWLARTPICRGQATCDPKNPSCKC